MGEGTSLVEVISQAFAAEKAAVPALTLRAGNRIDDYQPPVAFDPAQDAVSDGYLEQYSWGVAHLDPASWRYYLPFLMEYALRHLSSADLIVEALLNSLRPPDRDPPRLASLSPDQEAAVCRLLEVLAFDPDSAHQDLACQVLEEWWVPNALYRSRSD